MTQKPQLSFQVRIRCDLENWDFAVSEKGFTVGRTSESDVVLPLSILSRKHIQFSLQEGRWICWDCGSSNGTYLKSKKLEPQKKYVVTFPLEIQIGQNTKLVMELTEVQEKSVKAELGIEPGKSTQKAESPRAAPPKPQREETEQQKPVDPPPTAALASQRAEKIALESEIEKLTAQRNKALQEYQDLKDGKTATQAQVKELEDQITKLSTEKSILIEDISSLKKEKDSAYHESQTKKDELVKITKELDSLWQAREERREELRQVESKVETQRQELSTNQKNLTTCQDELNKTLSQNESILKKLTHATDDLEELKKEKASLEDKIKSLKQEKITALDEFQRAKSSFEAEQKKLTDLKNSTEIVESQKKRMEMTLDGVRSELVVAEEKLRSAIKTRQENEDTYHAQQKELNTITTQIASGKNELLNLQSKITGLGESHRQSIEKLKAELLNLEETEKNRLKEAFVKNAQNQERELAERQKKALDTLEQEKQRWIQERNNRRPTEIKEILRASAELFSAHIKNHVVDIPTRNKIQSNFSTDLKDILNTVMNSNPGSTQHTTHLKGLVAASPEAKSATKLYWKHKGIQIGIGATLVLTMILFPSIPKSVIEGAKDLTTREPAGANAFVEQVKLARANRPKFMPEMNKEFRETYTDNILYLTGYIELKSNEEIKNEWTKQLNDFLQENFEFTDRAIVSFMAIEGPLIAELSQMRSQIEPYNELDKISKMKEIESQAQSRFLKLMKSDSNWIKVREFERKFYLEYANKL